MDTPSTITDLFTLEYHGTPVEMGRMNSYEVASYIISFSDFLGVISRTTYGEKIELRTEIQGFRNNSFDIDFFLQIGGLTMALLFSSPFSIKDMIELIKESIKIWIHLHGLPSKSVTVSPDKQNLFQVENQNEAIIYCNADVINVINNPKANKAVEQFIKKPLESGLEYLRINSKSSHEITRIENKDAPYFIPISLEKPLAESEMKMSLLIESPTFKEDNKWKFFDGQDSFYADILDEEFLDKVNKGKERFGKGDTLNALVRFRQTESMGYLKMERVIVEVYKHEIAVNDIGLFS
jgi:hypothetical protein